MTTTSPPTTPKPRRRWLKFSRRALLLFAVILSVFLGWFGSIVVRVRQQRAVVSHIQSLGGSVLYEFHASGEHVQTSPPPGPKIIRMVVGDDAFASVESVFLDSSTRVTNQDLVLLVRLPELKGIALHGPVNDSWVTLVARVTLDVHYRPETIGKLA